MVHPGAGAVRDHDGRERRPRPSVLRRHRSLHGVDTQRLFRIRPSRAMMHAMAGTLHLGTSGFSFDGWKHGVFYPEGLKNREMLTYYSQPALLGRDQLHLPALPLREVAAPPGASRAADGFTFTLKANQRITHFKRLADTDEDVRALPRAREAARRQARDVLFQCPPSLHYDRALIEAFVGYLPPGRPVRDGVPAPLVDRGEGPVADPRASRGASPRPTRRTPGPTTSRGSRSGTCACGRPSTPTRSSAHGPIASRPSLDAGADVFCYFKHEEDGAGPKMAKRLRATLDDRRAGAASA